MIILSGGDSLVQARQTTLSVCVCVSRYTCERMNNTTIGPADKDTSKNLFFLHILDIVFKLKGRKRNHIKNWNTRRKRNHKIKEFTKLE